MGQITEGFANQMLTHCARKEHPPLTVWEAEQLVMAWLDRERLRDALRPMAECHLPPVGFEQHGVTAHFTTAQIIAAREALAPNAAHEPTATNKQGD